MVTGQRCSQQCTQGIKWSGGAAVCRPFNWKDAAEIILSGFVHQKGSPKGRVSQEDTLSFCLKSPKRSRTLWGEINGEPWMLGMRWEGQRSNSLELTCCCSIASLPITSNTQSRELYHKSEWISPLKAHLRACSLRRRVRLGLPCSTFAHSPFHSHSAYWKYLVSLREWTRGHTGFFHCGETVLRVLICNPFKASTNTEANGGQMHVCRLIVDLALQCLSGMFRNVAWVVWMYSNLSCIAEVLKLVKLH